MGEASLRVRGDATFQATGYAAQERDLAERLVADEQAFVLWEVFPVRVLAGRRVRTVSNCFVLWSPVASPTQVAVDEETIDYAFREDQPCPVPVSAGRSSRGAVATARLPGMGEQYRAPVRAAIERTLELYGSHQAGSPSVSSVPSEMFVPPEPESAEPRFQQTTYRGIARVNDPERGLSGYWVRTSYNRKRYARFFSDKKAGGDRFAALMDAVGWRDETERRIGKRSARGEVLATQPRSNTGSPGVTETHNAGRHIFQVTWKEGRKQRRTSVSIAKYGWDEAFKRAKAIYQKQTRAARRSATMAKDG